MQSSDLASVRRTLWAAADGFRANSKLTPVQYRPPVLGLIFLGSTETPRERTRMSASHALSAHAAEKSLLSDFRPRWTLRTGWPAKDPPAS